jgi:serine/threonine-protein kinase RsbW
MAQTASAGARRDFPRTLAAVSDVLDWAERFFESTGIGPDQRFGVQLGLEELFTNLVKYGAGTHPIEVELVRRDSVLLATLVDVDVEPFDPTAAPDADTTLPLDARRPGGLGLHLIRRVVDRVEYTYENRKSRTTLVKMLG